MQPFAVRRVRIRLDKPLVLFVTGDRNLREGAARGLEAEGFDVVPASHGGHALLACLAGTHADVLVTEAVMEEMTGPGLARRVRRHCPGLPVVYLGRKGLERPFTLEDLVREVTAALEGATAGPAQAS